MSAFGAIAYFSILCYNKPSHRLADAPHNQEKREAMRLNVFILVQSETFVQQTIALDPLLPGEERRQCTIMDSWSPSHPSISAFDPPSNYFTDKEMKEYFTPFLHEYDPDQLDYGYLIIQRRGAIFRDYTRAIIMRAIKSLKLTQDQVRIIYTGNDGYSAETTLQDFLQDVHLDHADSE